MKEQKDGEAAADGVLVLLQVLVELVLRELISDKANQTIMRAKAYRILGLDELHACVVKGADRLVDRPVALLIMRVPEPARMSRTRIKRERDMESVLEREIQKYRLPQWQKSEEKMKRVPGSSKYGASTRPYVTYTMN